MSVHSILPFFSAAITLVFAILVVRRFFVVKGGKRAYHLLLWGIGLLFYFLGSASEALHTAFGWSALNYRVWYLSGAILVAAWLGQGTAELLIRRRVVGVRVSRIMLAVLLGVSIFAAYRVFTAQLDPSLVGAELSGEAIVSGGVRSLTPFFNMYGVILLAGGALYSAFIFFRKRIMPNRVVGNVLIAAGAMMPAMAGLFSRFGLRGYLYVGELLGAILIFAGFVAATTQPQAAEVRQTAEASADGR